MDLTPEQREALRPLAAVIEGAITESPIRLGTEDWGTVLAATVLAHVAAYMGGIVPTPNRASLPEVWVVWREDQPAYAYFASEAAAKQGMVDYWEEDEPVEPGYGWRQDGARLELVVGGEPGGVYASRHRVYGPPAQGADDDPIRPERRNQIGNFLDRLQNHGSLTDSEAVRLREHIDIELRAVDTARSVAAGNLRHVQLLYSDVLEAQAAVKRVRALAEGTYYGITGRAFLAALDGPGQPSAEAGR
jgi:hypothetical protein